MEFTSVDLNEGPEYRSGAAASEEPHSSPIKNGKVDHCEEGNRDGEHLVGSDDSHRESAEPNSNSAVRQPRALSVNNKPNPLASRRGGSVVATLSPKTSEADMTSGITDYQARLKQQLEEEASVQQSEVPIPSEYEDKPRPPRAISMSGSAINPLAKRRGSAIRPTTTQVSQLEFEETVPVHPGLPSSVPPTRPPPPPLPSSPPPMPTAGEEDMMRPSVSLSFGGLYDVRPSMIETEYVADMRPESPMERMSAIQESDDDHHDGRYTNEDEVNETMEGVYDIRVSTIEVERPKPPPVPPSPPPMSAPPVPSQPLHAPPPPPSPVAESDSDSPAHPLADVDYSKQVRMSYASDDEESPAHPAHKAKQPKPPTSPSYTARAPPPAVTTSSLVYKDMTPKPNDVYLAGIGWKLCPSIAIVWQERYFVLKTDASVHYYTDKASFLGGFAPRGVIVINDIQRGVKGGIHVELLQNKLNIGVHSKNSRVYKLKFGTAEEAAKWKDAIFRFVK